MIKSSKTLLISVLTGSILSVSALAAENTIPEVYKFVPKDALMAFDIKTGKDAWKIFSTNKSLSKIDLFKMMTEDLTAEEKKIAEQIKNSLGDNILFSMSNLDFNIKNEKDSIGLLFISEMKNTSHSVNLRKVILDNIKKDKKSKISVLKLQGNEIYKLASSKDKNDMYLSFIDKYVIISDARDKITESINAYYNRSTNTLMSSSDFVKSYNKLDNNYQIQFYLNNRKFFNTFYNSKEMKKAMSELDFDYNNLMTSNSTLFNFNVLPTGAFVKSYSVLDKENTISKTLLETNSSNFKKYTSLIPKNTLFFTSISDMQKIGSQFANILPKSKDFNIGDISKEALGINILDATNNLQGDFAMAIFNTESSPLIPGFALMVTPKDRNEMINLVNSIKLEPGQDKGMRNQKVKKDPIYLKFINKTNYKNSEIFSVNEIPETAEFGIKPAYSFIGNDMIISSNEEVMKSIIDRGSDPNANYNLQGNEGFNKAIKYFGENSNSLSFVNLSSIINMISPFMQKEKDLKESLDQFKKFELIGANSTNDSEGVLGNFALFADINNIDFNKIIPASVTKGFNTTKTNAQISSVKANMHTTQVLVETHGVDWVGLYPNTVKELVNESNKNDYSKDFKNPITLKSGIGKAGSLIDYNTYINQKTNLSLLKGMVIYQPLKCKYNKSAKRTLCESYKIYGSDDKGLLIKEKGQNFYLTNQ